MNAALKMSFNNKYAVQLIDSCTGKVKKEGVFHNIPTDGFMSSLLGIGKGYISPATHQYALAVSSLAVGSGTTEPAYNNSGLANRLWTVSATSRNFKWLDEYTGQVTAIFTFPATTDYIGTITEVGLYNWQYVYSSSVFTSTVDNPAAMLCTRALLTDSEGQLISFEKTALDILQVTVIVEMSLRSTSETFGIFKYPYIIKETLNGNSYATHNGGGNFANYYGNMNLLRFNHDVERLIINSSGTTLEQAVSATPNAYYDDTSAYIEYPVARLLSTVQTSIRYYKAVAIPGIGFWRLPNENILPTFTITDIEIGTGDGVTTQFTNPLNYFKKDTEVIYKNGVALTRGVDYTINNAGNKDCLPEVTELAGIPKVTSAAKTTTTLTQKPLFIPTVVSGSPSYLAERFDMSVTALCFSNANPLFIEYPEAVTMNCMKCTGNLRNMNGTNGYNNIPSGTKFFIDYSDDGITYQELGSATLIEANGPFTIDFADTTAKYWRLRTSYSDIVSIYGGTEYYMTLNRKDPYIVFTEAPADGDVLTMDVGMDIIMKNDKFIVDLGCRLDLSL